MTYCIRLGSFVALIHVVLGADRERARRAQRTDFLEAYKQTKKHLKVNKNLIPKIQFQFGTDADADVDVDIDVEATTQNRKEVNGDNIKSQFHQWAGKAVVPSIARPSARPSVRPLPLSTYSVTCRRRLLAACASETASAAQLTGKRL